MAKLKNLKILFVSPEVAPFVKTGGVADVSGSLPQALVELGHEVRIVLPKYGAVDERRFKIHEIVRLKDIPLHLGEEIELYSIRSSFLTVTKTKAQIYFFDNHKYFGSRKGLYQDINTKKDYPDNYERFIFFNKGIIEMLKKLGWTPDIIHCHDWQSGLIPAYLKTECAGMDLFENTKCVFTVHNVAFQGLFSKDCFKLTGLPNTILNENGLELNGKISFLKSGLVFADAITTVSEKYAEELCSLDELSGNLKSLFNKRKKDLVGIPNGIDYNVWNPETDPLIKQTYNSKSITKKVENKKDLCEYFNLPFDENIPLLASVSQLTELKGYELIEKAINEIMALGVQYVILGQGDKKYQEFFEKVQKKYPKQFAIKLGFDDELAHKIIAGADIFLMPSKFEPGGLTQLYSLRYGTVPVVHYVGGLADTIEKISKEGDGTGFAFKEFEVEAMLSVLKKAVKLFASKDIWVKIMKNGMNQDYSWNSSAKKYVELYKRLLKDF